jgi:hypothetical protein
MALAGNSPQRRQLACCPEPNCRRQQLLAATGSSSRQGYVLDSAIRSASCGESREVALLSPSETATFSFGSLFRDIKGGSRFMSSGPETTIVNISMADGTARYGVFPARGYPSKAELPLLLWHVL